MKVKELIEKLQEFDQNKDIIVECYDHEYSAAYDQEIVNMYEYNGEVVIKAHME